MPWVLEQFGTTRLLGLDLCAASLAEVTASLVARPAQETFSYIVTPNADHFVRLRSAGSGLLAAYRCAGSLLLDSRVVGAAARALRLPVPPVIPGSDLTAELLQRWIEPDEPVTVIGTTPAAVASLRSRFRLTRLAHACPPFGFERHPEIIEECAAFVEAHPARFVFIACGAPRQEMLALRIHQRGRASGIGLCIGAAIDQVGGYEMRAPEWMRHHGLEWAWRIGCEPRRMGQRYLRNAAIFPMLLAEARRAMPE
jgi:exopolysaccharide biosynthesis WecB/TagA/CpsF family protein